MEPTNVSPTSTEPRHGPGETSGSPQRPAQKLTGTVLTFDLATELERLRQEQAYLRGNRNANTLVKEASIRVVLTALKQGARIDQHKTDGPFTMQVVNGHVRVHLPAGAVDLPQGHLLSVEGGVDHDVEAVEESAFLLTIVSPA